MVSCPWSTRRCVHRRLCTAPPPGAKEGVSKAETSAQIAISPHPGVASTARDAQAALAVHNPGGTTRHDSGSRRRATRDGPRRLCRPPAICIRWSTSPSCETNQTPAPRQPSARRPESWLPPPVPPHWAITCFPVRMHAPERPCRCVRTLAGRNPVERSCPYWPKRGRIPVAAKNT
jgi:hypothetical protein